MTYRALFICTGNLHRSVMAEYLFRAMTQQLGLEVMVQSAGCLDLSGHGAPIETVAALAELGIPCEGHASKRVSESMLRQANLVVVMAQKHAEFVAETHAPAADSIVHLGDYMSPACVEVADPIGGSMEDFRTCRDGILGALQSLLPEILPEMR